MNAPATASFATEGGHWYQSDGSAAYTIKARDGSERPTTLRDARKLMLWPSVTTIIAAGARPALERWKAEQLMLAALTLPRKDGEAEADWIARVRLDSQEQARAAAERGTAIHGAIERDFRRDLPASCEYAEHVLGVRAAVWKACGRQNWLPERSFCHELGYGGKTDLHSAEPNSVAGWVIDFKTKEFADESEPKIYDEHPMQLSAYRRGLRIPDARCAIAFVSTTKPGLVAWREITENDLVRGLAMFDALLGYWQAKTGHRP